MIHTPRPPHEVLGIASSATPEEIKKAYRALALKTHPDVDKTPGAEDRMKELNAAYSALTDGPGEAPVAVPQPGAVHIVIIVHGGGGFGSPFGGTGGGWYQTNASTTYY